MKTILFAALMAVSGMAEAGYFHTIDVKHPQLNAGTSIGNGFVRPTTMLALITHSPDDGYWLVPGVNWTPLAIGGGFKSGQFHLAAGPSFNLLPAIQSVLYEFVTDVTDPDKYLNLKSILVPGSKTNGDIVGAVGVNLEYDFTIGKFQTPLFAGVSWKF